MKTFIIIIMYISHLINVYFSGEATTAVIPSTNSVFGSGFGKSEFKADVSVSSASSSMPVNIFAAGSQTTSFIAPSQVSTPAFGSTFNNNAALTSLDASAASTSSSILFNLSTAVKQPPSSSLTFGSFSNLGSSASTEVSSSSRFGGANGSETTGDNAGTPLTFGALPRSSFEVQSSDSKPLFPIMPQSTSSVFGVGNANKPQTGTTTGVFGRAFAAATAGQKAKENKEKVAEEKIRGLDTSSLTALVIKDIPDAYNKNAWLKRFYSRFGEVTKVLCSAAKKSASVAFKTHVSKVPGLYVHEVSTVNSVL